MEQYLDLTQLQKSLPLHVAVYPHKHSERALSDVISGLKDVFRTEVLGKENRLAEFFHIQSLPLDEQKKDDFGFCRHTPFV